MRFSAVLTTLTLGSAVALAAASSTQAAGQVDASVATSLKTIQRDADAIAAGHYSGKALQAPAHEIGAEWYKVAPILMKNGSVLVETRMTNATITAFEKDWQHSGKARSAAKDVSSSVADLITATQTSGASPASGSASSGAPAAGAASPAASPAPSSSPG